MGMVVYKLNGSNDDEIAIKKAGEALHAGKLVVFPTETVYGLGADAMNPSAVMKIFEAKGRPSDNPLIAHINHQDMLSCLTGCVGSVEAKLMNAFWPGPLTIIFPKSEKVPLEVTGGTEYVAVRMPSNPAAQKVIYYANTPIVAPSANKSGKPSGTQVSDVVDELRDFVDIFLDAGSTDIGLESTVVKVQGGVPVVLRPGKITPDDIKKIVGDVLIDDGVFKKHLSDAQVVSPGMKYRHYAPDCESVLVEGDNEKIKVGKICEIIRQRYPQKVVVMCANENRESYASFENAIILPMGDYLDYDEISQNLFSLLRRAERFDPSLVLIECVPKEGLGIALMNRLIRACGYNIV